PVRARLRGAGPDRPYPERRRDPRSPLRPRHSAAAGKLPSARADRVPEPGRACLERAPCGPRRVRRRRFRLLDRGGRGARRDPGRPGHQLPGGAVRVLPGARRERLRADGVHGVTEALTLRDRFVWMARMRAFEEVCLEGVASQEIHGELHLGIGQEAIAAGMVGALRPEDAVVSTHRNHLHAIAKGVPLRPLLAEIYERETGLCRGRGGHMHPFDPERRFSATGIVGSAVGVALGYAYAAWIEESGAVSVGVTGDGGVNTGAFHESMNMAGAWRLPL